MVLRALVVLWALAAALPLAAEVPADPEAAERGRRIFLNGQGRDEIVAVLPGDLEIPGATLTCGGCHGRRGEGRPEGGVSPSKLAWHLLTRPYEVETPAGRRHGPYTERSLKRAITMGFDPAGNELQSAMPRYRMSQRDMADLLHFLRNLDAEEAPGVGEGELQLGTLLLEEGPLAPASRAMAETLEAVFKDLNVSGGVFGRRLKLRTLPADAMADADVFAWVGGILPDGTERLLEHTALEKQPWIGPRSFLPQNPWVDDRTTFYLEGDLLEAVTALAHHAVGRWPTARPWILHSDDPRLLPAVERIAEDLKELGRPAAERLAVEALPPEEVLKRLAEYAPGPVFLLVPGPGGSALAEALTAEKQFEVLAPAVLAGTWDQGVRRLHLAMPVIPQDRMESDLEELSALLRRHALPFDHLASRLHAVVAARVLVAGLERCGRALERETLVAALADLRDFETGLTRPISFGPHRRVGLDGMYVVSFTGRTPEATWYRRYVETPGWNGRASSAGRR